jgi:hypothetical protein
MEKDIIKKKFFRFLKNRNCFAQFIKRFNSEEGISERLFWANRSHKAAFKEEISSGFVSYFGNLRKPSDLLQYAFLWEKTEEGHEFWKAIGEEWRIELRKIN